MAVVTFDADAFTLRFPEFFGVDAALLALYFDEACMYLDNTDASPVVDASQRSIMLNLLTAHIATVNGYGTGKPKANGQITTASEGGVSASFATAPISTAGLSAWLQQTQYGASYWAMTSRYRSFFYVR